MSVKELTFQDATTLIGTARTTEAPVTKNFYDVFGTSGCLRSCGKIQTMEKELRREKVIPGTRTTAKKRESTYNMNTRLRDFWTTHNNWFTANEMRASAAQGCGSCRVLLEIISKVMNAQEDCFDSHEYFTAKDFEIKCRIMGSDKTVKTFQLFQPPSAHIRFERFTESSFLAGKDQSLVRLREWMEACKKHTICSQEIPGQTNESLPTRLLHIDLQREGVAGVRLIQTVSGTPYRYACLSHRWDKTIKLGETTTNNLASRLTFFPLHKLPRNFQDAIEIARRLSLNYVWIDSLCIVQSGDSLDLMRELAKMGSIYRGAEITIAAVSSANSSDGCFINDQWPDICLSITKKQEKHVIGARILDGQGHPESTEDVNAHYSLLTRGWVFQERLLSRRFLYCNYGEFAFECLESSTCECRSRIAPHVGGVHKGSQQSIRHMIFSRRRNVLSERNANSKLILEYWQVAVEMYLELDLTVSGDILPAIAGFAKLVELKLGLNYVAGLWREHLTANLLWHVNHRRHKSLIKARPLDSTAPSWSWASIAMMQTIAHVDRYKGGTWSISKLLLNDKIKGIHCQPKDATNPLGKVKRASLRIHAALYPWYMRSICTLSTRSPGLITYSFHDLNLRNSARSLPCTSELSKSGMNNMIAEFHLDAPLQNTGLDADISEQCESNMPPSCTLKRVYLLPALHKENGPKSFDVLLVLQHIPPVLGKPNCYQRVGLLKIHNENAGGKTWDALIWDRTKARSEMFWLF